MTETTKARLATIPLGSRTIEGFMMPDESYVMSQDQAAECIAQTKRNLSDFLRSKAVKTLLGKDYTSPKNRQIAIETTQQRGGAKISPLMLDEVGAYWVWQCYRR